MAAINRLYMLLTVVGGAMVLRLVIFTAHSMKNPRYGEVPRASLGAMARGPSREAFVPESAMPY